MKIKLFLWITLCLLLLQGVSALDAQISTPVKSTEPIILPTTKATNLSVTFDLEWRDDISDLKYILTISGPATFENGKKELFENIGDLNKDTIKLYTLHIVDTESARQESVYIRLDGAYVNTKFFGGGKKDLNKSTSFGVISSEKAQVQQEKEQLEQGFQICSSDLTACESQLSSYESNISMLTNELNSLQDDAKYNRILLLGYLLVVVIIIILVLYIIKLRDDVRRARNNYH